MNPDGVPGPHESATEAVKALQEDLEALAASDPPFASDAEQILNVLAQANSEEKVTR